TRVRSAARCTHEGAGPRGLGSRGRYWPGSQGSSNAPTSWRGSAGLRGHGPMTVAEGRVSFVVAINQALREEMAADRAVYVLGEDVAVGGPFGATAGLAETFGERRVRNTPISE